MTNPLDTLVNLYLGFLHEGHAQAWCRLIASIMATAFITFFGTIGLSVMSQMQIGTLPAAAIVLAVAHASLLMALMVLGIWLKSPLTKNIPIMYPGKIEAARLEQLADDGSVFNPNKEKR